LPLLKFQPSCTDNTPYCPIRATSFGLFKTNIHLDRSAIIPQLSVKCWSLY